MGSSVYEPHRVSVIFVNFHVSLLHVIKMNQKLVESLLEKLLGHISLT